MKGEVYSEYTQLCFVSETANPYTCSVQCALYNRTFGGSYKSLQCNGTCREEVLY